MYYFDSHSILRNNCYWHVKASLCHVIAAQLRDANVGLPVTSLLATLAVVY